MTGAAACATGAGVVAAVCATGAAGAAEFATDATVPDACATAGIVLPVAFDTADGSPAADAGQTGIRSIAATLSSTATQTLASTRRRLTKHSVLEAECTDNRISLAVTTKLRSSAD